MTKPDLVLTFLNTRPVEQAAALSESVRQQGHQVLECPALVIRSQPLPNHAEKALPEFDKVFFISQNAVKQLTRLWQDAYQVPLAFSNHTKCFAIGQSTYNMMKAQGWTVVTPSSEQYVTESLLALEDLQALAGQRCLIVKGDGGRPALAQGLKEAGATVTEWAVYQRVTAEFCSQEWQAFQKARHPVLLISSLDAWSGLQQMLEHNGQWAESDQAWLFLQDVIVFSERIKLALQQQGWQGRLLVVPQQSNSGILASLKNISIER